VFIVNNLARDIWVWNYRDSVEHNPVHIAGELSHPRMGNCLEE